jgi:membrane fusion protein, multidrug efflux system
MAQATQRHRTRTAWLALLLLAAALAVAAGGWWRFGPASGTPSQERARATPPAAPVHTAIVETKSFPVVLNGLGTVQATNTVIVRSRVDGQIERVTFEEGQMVNEGELLVQIDPAPFQAALDQAIAKHGQDEASLTNAKQDLQRTSILSKQGNATQQLLDQRTAQVASLTAQVQADQAAIASAKVQLNYTTIKSPLSGRAGFRLVDPGNIVHANDQNGILTITQLQPISVIFTAPEQDLPAINEALKSGPLQVTAFSSDGHKPLADGTLKLIDNQVDVASGTIKLKATFDNKNGALWPGLSVSTRLLVKTINNVVVVPDSAVQRGPNGLFAYVVSADSKAQLRNLKVGRIEDGQALVEDGLAAGERIVTSGHYRVQAGAAVEIVDGQTQKTANKRADDKVD